MADEADVGLLRIAQKAGRVRRRVRRVTIFAGIICYRRVRRISPWIRPGSLPRGRRGRVARAGPVFLFVAGGAKSACPIVRAEEFSIAVGVRIVAGSALHLPGIVKARGFRQSGRFGKLALLQGQSRVVHKGDGMIIRKIGAQGGAARQRAECYRAGTGRHTEVAQRNGSIVAAQA